MPTLVNGLDGETVASSDRGLQYGDGIFETIAVRNGTPLLWHAHLDRLARGVEALGLPAIDIGALNADVARLTTGTGHAVLKILLTAGTGGRGYARALQQPACNRIVSLHPFPDHPPARWFEGVRVHVCVTRLALQPRLAGIKHCNRLEQVLARQEWSSPDIAEGLMQDTRGLLAEGTMSNIFAAQGGRLMTPALTECGVHGVMRETILEIAPEAGYPVEFMDAPLADWLEADEIFLANSIIGLWPVRLIGERTFAPGPVCHALQQRLAAGPFACMPLITTDEG